MHAPGREESPRGVLILKRGALSDRLASNLLSFEDSLSSGSFEVLRRDGSSLASSCREFSPVSEKRFVVRFSEDDEELVIKLSRFRRLLAQLPLRGLRRSAPEAQWAVMGHALQRGVRVAEIKASGLLYSSEFQAPVFSFSVMKSLRALPDLTSYLMSILGSSPDKAAARTLIRTYLARKIAEAHMKGFFHSDLKGYHILVDTKGSSAPGSAEWIWLDLDDVRILRRLSERQCVENLYQLWRYVLMPIDPEGLEAFAEEYLRAASGSSVDQRAFLFLGNHDSRSLAASIERHFAKRAARRSARTRPRFRFSLK